MNLPYEEMEDREPNRYTDNQIQWLKEYFEAEIKSIREAVDKETKINTDKFANNNEWKQTIKDQISRSPSREELVAFAYKEQLAKFAIKEEIVSRDTFDTWKKENDSWKNMVAPVTDVAQLEKRVDDLKTSYDQGQGIIRFLQFAGAAGIIGLLIGILRLAGFIK